MMEQFENVMVNEEKPVRIAERFKFFKRDQLEEETITVYLMELKILATTCEFSVYLEEALCDKFVCGIQDESIQADLLTRHDLTLEIAYQYALTMEVARYGDKNEPFLTRCKEEEDELSNFENCHSSFDIKEELQPCELQEEFKVHQEFVEWQSEPNLLLGTDCDEQLLLLNNGDGKKNFVCEYCHSVFSTNSQMMRHLRSHTGEKPFVCMTCNKGFSKGEILRRHTQKSSACADYEKQKPTFKKNIKADKGKAEQICATCGRIFLMKSHLERHLKIHTGAKPYTCAICKNTFTRKESLRKHLQIHGFGEHGIQNSAKKCKICSQSFLKKLDLQQHLKSHPDDTSFLKNASIPPVIIPLESMVCESEVPHVKIKGRVKRKHRCLYCDQDVANFSRHLERNHADEIAVQEVMKQKKKSKERKKLVDKLRREGDFSTSKVVPVMSVVNTGETNYIACKFCRGYYSCKSLRRHAKKCYFNPDPSKRFNAQSEGQTLMVGSFGPNDPLMGSGLLNMMRADDVTMTAKKDAIICEVGRRYLRSHKEKHLLIVAKRNMRRLARLLISVRGIENNQTFEMIDILTPHKYKSLIRGTREIAEYDYETRTFKSPSLAFQMGTLIKSALDVAHSEEGQKENFSKERLEELKTLTTLIETDWAHKISSEAGRNLAINKYNEPTLIPITEV